MGFFDWGAAGISRKEREIQVTRISESSDISNMAYIYSFLPTFSYKIYFKMYKSKYIFISDPSNSVIKHWW